VGLEALLGFTRRGDTLFIEPRVPASWPEYGINYRVGESTYEITVLDPAQVAEQGAAVSLDGVRLVTPGIPLVDDGLRHQVTVRPDRAGDLPAG
jgi:cyclic beta-1,2-glucan synthetase